MYGKHAGCEFYVRVLIAFSQLMANDALHLWVGCVFIY